MASLSFEGETHTEILQKVRRWLGSVEGAGEGHLSATEAVNHGAELTKEALRVIAQAAPAPVAQSELFQALTSLGYKATDATREALVDGLDTLEQATGGSLVEKVSEAGRAALYQMREQVAKQVLRSMTQR